MDILFYCLLNVTIAITNIITPIVWLSVHKSGNCLCIACIYMHINHVIYNTYAINIRCCACMWYAESLHIIFTMYFPTAKCICSYKRLETRCMHRVSPIPSPIPFQFPLGRLSFPSIPSVALEFSLYSLCPVWVYPPFCFDAVPLKIYISFKMKLVADYIYKIFSNILNRKLGKTYRWWLQTLSKWTVWIFP